MKNQNYHYIAQLENGLYWAGMNTFTDQIRKAQMYNSTAKAIEAVEYAIKRNRAFITTLTYRLLKVEIHVLESDDWQTVDC